MEEDEYIVYCPECDWTGLSSECRLADDSRELLCPVCGEPIGPDDNVW